MIPGELWTQPGEIQINVGRSLVTLRVANSGDRPIQVGSHYHFYETNDALSFDRTAAYGFRLNIPAGTAVRFEPGQGRDVELVALAGARRVFGFAGKVMGPLRAGGAGAAKGKAAPKTKGKPSVKVKGTAPSKTAASKTSARSKR